MTRTLDPPEASEPYGPEASDNGPSCNVRRGRTHDRSEHPRVMTKVR